MLYHRHTEVVALIHLVVSLLEGITLTSTLLSQVLSEGSTATLLVIGTHIYNLDALQVELQAVGNTLQAVWVAQEDRLADALCLSLNGSLQHGWVATLGEYDTLWMEASCIVELASQLGLLTEQLAQMLLVCLPVGDRSTSHTAVHGSLGDGSTYLSDQTWIDWFWNEVFRTEGEVVDMIYVIDYIWHWLLSQVGDGVNSSQLHLLVDGTSVNIERATEDIWETDHIVDLVRIIGTTC